MKLNIKVFESIDYLEALEMQRELQEQRIQEKISDTLLVLQHNSVLTLGKRGQYSNILVSEEYLKENGIETVEIERGGDVTYHGPGQLVVYPILDLTNHKKDIRRFISMLQDVIINVLRDKYDIISSKKTGVHTGVWIDDKKIAAIGISISKWVTMHGFALNVNTDLSKFELIVPCGLAGSGVASIEQLSKKKVDFNEARDLIQDEFIKVFGYSEVCLQKC